MSCPHIVWALREGKARKLTAYERLVLMVVAERANGDLICWPSIDLLAEDAGMSRRSVQAALRKLHELKLIRIEERHRKTSIYHVLRPKDAVLPGLDQGAGDAPSQGAGDASQGANAASPRVQEMQIEGAGGAPESPRESPSTESPNKEGRDVVLRTTATAAPPPLFIDVRKQLYSDGKQIIRRNIGCLEKAAGGLVTRWQDLSGDNAAVVLACLHDAEREGVPPDGFVGWVTNAIKRRTEVVREFDPNKLSGSARALWNLEQELQARECVA